MSPSRLIATWFGAGLCPWAPGTAGTLATVPLVAAAWLLEWRLALPVLGVVVALIGVFVGARAARERGVHDPAEVVIDEVAGFLLACSLVQPGWVSGAAAFALFRVLDIAKPWPLRALERLPGGWGIMADDVVAGLVAGSLVRGAGALLAPSAA